jgi:CRISPR-associated protein Cas2
MRGFGDAVQYSVFQCDLSPAERVLLLESLTAAINHRDDSVLLIDLGPRDGRGRESVEAIGRPREVPKSDRVAVVV